MPTPHLNRFDKGTGRVRLYELGTFINAKPMT